MLDQLVELLRAGGTHRVTDLARALETTPELIEAMLETLTRMGYVRRLAVSCVGASCGACPVAGLCTAEGSGRVWALTEKGATPTAE